MSPISVGASADKTYSLVQLHYGKYAKLNDELSDEKLSTHNERVASAFGYSSEDLAAIPENANLGVSCGNPIATANLKPGETVIDLGSGAGLDVLIAARKVGLTGKAIGIDMTQEMLDLAAKNAEKGGYANVEFVMSSLTIGTQGTQLMGPDEKIKSYIHSTPSLSDGAADVITSNCVINLLPTSQKREVFVEIYRLLKPGGRVAISDILGKKEFPEELRASVACYISCIGGASEVWEYETWLKDAGFEDIIILDTVKDLNIYKEGILSACAESSDSMNNSSCCKPSSKPTETTTARCGGMAFSNMIEGGVEEKIGIVDYDLNEWAGAFQIYAIKSTKT